MVEQLLTDYPVLRDNDSQLIAVYWRVELEERGLNIIQMRGYELLALLGGQKLTAPDSITRMRRKLQEENESLRGKVYYERHKQVKTVQKELGYGTL